MKKLLLIIAAIFTLNSVHADLILHESFDREVGKLNSGAIPSTTITDTENWYTKNATAKNIITVAEGSLSYPDYVATGTGNKALLITANSSLSQDLRMLKTTVTEGKVYLSAIINVDELNKTDNGVKGAGAYCLAFGEGSTSAAMIYARLFIRSVKEGDDFVGFNMGVTKNNEGSAGVAWATTVFTEKTDYLVVLEYEFVKGEKNDTARLYVNPVKSVVPPMPTLVCVQSFINDKGNEQGACGKADANAISSIFLNETARYNPNRLFVDEIKVATAWEDLFEDGGDTPIEKPAEITTTLKNILFGQSGIVYTNETYNRTFVVKGKNLKGDITLSTDNTQLTLDKTTITKAEAESENGVEVTATLVPTSAGCPEEGVTISLTSDGATASILTYWNVRQVTICNTIAELKTEAAKGEGESLMLKFKGEALVTYVSRLSSGYTVYIQDNTAAAAITDTYWPTSIKIGDKLTDFTVKEGVLVLGIQPLITETPDVTIVSSDNEVVPQVVTLAELKAHAADYLMELVKVENVTLDQTSTKFGQTNDDNTPIADTFTQDGNTATINLVEGNELIGATKPQKADVIGISSNATGNVIRVRGVADVISKDNPTAIDNVAMDELLSGEYEVYTVSGQRIDALQPGVNIIRKGNTTYKVVR